MVSDGKTIEFQANYRFAANSKLSIITGHRNEEKKGLSSSFTRPAIRVDSPSKAQLARDVFECFESIVQKGNEKLHKNSFE